MTSRALTWRPDRVQLVFPDCSELTTDSILTMGVMQATDYVLQKFGVWAQGDPAHHSEEVLAAFADAFANCAKKYRERVAPVVKSIVRVGQPTLIPSEATLLKLSTLCCDLGDLEAGRTLLERCKSKPYGQSVYLNLIRLGAETASEPDMELVFDVLDTMADNNVPLVACFPLRLILYGLSRMPSPPWETAAAIMDLRLRLDHNLDRCVVSAFCSVAEKITGAQIPNVIRFLDQMNPQLLKLPVMCCSPPKNKIETTMSAKRYTLVDPMTVELCSRPPEPSAQDPQHNVCFLYSSVRQLVERQKCVSMEHKFSRCLDAVRQQVEAAVVPCQACARLNIFVLTLQSELAMRTGYNGACPKTHQDRILVFIDSLKLKYPDNLPGFAVATTDATLIKELAVRGIRVVAQVE